MEIKRQSEVENVMSLSSQMIGNDRKTRNSSRMFRIAALSTGFLLATATVALSKDYDGNPPGPIGGPGTNWENPPGPVGGPGASPDSRWTRAQWRRHCANHPRACRRAVRHHDFDTSPCWLGPACLDDFGQADYARRRKMIGEARQPGTLAQDVHMDIHKAIESGQIHHQR